MSTTSFLPHRLNDDPQPERLATLVRDGGEVRIELARYNGHAYIALRFWAHGRGGKLFPTKRGVTIRRSEIAQVVVALQHALEMLYPSRKVPTMGSRNPGQLSSVTGGPGLRLTSRRGVDGPEGSDG